MIGAVETITDITELIEKDNQIAAYERQLRSDDGFCGIIGFSFSDIILNIGQKLEICFRLKNCRFLMNYFFNFCAI